MSENILEKIIRKKTEKIINLKKTIELNLLRDLINKNNTYIDFKEKIENNINNKFAWIVNSEDGLDEISPYAKTNIVQLKDKKISEITIDPKELNINADKFENLVGDDAKFNAEKMVNIFKGEDNDFSKAVCLNAAAGLIVNETHQNFTDAYNNTREHILSCKVVKHLEKIQNA